MTTLYFQPGACSRIALNALEEVGIPYEKKALNLTRGDQYSEEFLAVNPKGKVPTLIYDDQVITENPAISYFLHQQFPQAKLLPTTLEDPLSIEGLSDLIWCGSQLHPMVRQLLKPEFYSTGDPTGVRTAGEKQISDVATSLQKKLTNQDWWYGEKWSIVDVYLTWIIDTAIVSGFNFDNWAALLDYRERVRSRTSFRQALSLENQALVKIDMQLPPGVTL